MVLQESITGSVPQYVDCHNKRKNEYGISEPLISRAYRESKIMGMEDLKKTAGK